MREIPFDDIKRIALDVLKDFDRVCKDNNILYSLGYGTLLGAIRHQGFIPWDDDIDIVIARPEYEKFLKVRNQLSERYTFISVDTNGAFTAPLAKIYDNTTVLIENEHRDKVRLGIYIDILVFDYVPNNKIYKKLVYTRSYISQKMWGLATYPSRTNIIIEKWARSLALMFNLGRKASLASNAVNRRNKKTDYMCNLLYTIYGYEKDTFPSNKLYDCTLVEFEDSQFFAFTDYNYFLSQWYGDYMKLPPVEKQVTHHNFKVFWKDYKNAARTSHCK